jgi:putative ABC transport system permease protein
MSLRARFSSCLRAVTHRSRLDDEMEAELRSHIENYAQDLESSGLDRDEALRCAKAELGSIAAQKEHCRESLGLRLWDDLLADLRFAARQLRHAPAFTCTVLIVLALGIGANAAMFSVLDVTLLRWLPYARPGELVSLTVKDAQGSSSWAFYPDIIEWQQQTHTLQSIAYYEPGAAQLQNSGGTVNLAATRASSNLLATLGTDLAMGRSFTSEEQEPGKSRVVILSDGAWRSLFHADQEILGKELKLDDKPYTIIGVARPGFLFPADERRPQVWVPVELPANRMARDFSAGFYYTIGRMRSGVTPAEVRTEMSGIQKRLASLYKGDISGRIAPSQIDAIPYRETLVKDTRPALLALLLAIALIWLIACANVANLMLARSTARQRELAVRGALGASRWRIIRQLFTESLLLSLLGAAMGLGLAQLLLRLFDKALTERLNIPERFSPNPTVLGALVLLSVLSAVLFGLLPACLASGSPIEQSLRQSSAQTTGNPRTHRLQRVMVVAEIGLSLVLLVGCGLLLRTIFELRRVPLGFRTDHVLVVQPKLSYKKYAAVDVKQFIYEPLLERIKRIHGVRAASLTTIVPLHRGFTVAMTLYVGADKKTGQGERRVDARLKATGPELQQVLGFRMYQGRYFNEQDTPDAQPVAVVNRAFARLYAPDSDIIGKFSVSLAKGRDVKIVGVMDDFRQAAVNEPAVPEIDFCAPQLKPTDGFYQPTFQAHLELAVRTELAPAAVVPEIRRAMAATNADLESAEFQTMDEIVDDSIGSQLLAAHLLEIFSGSALLVALAGLYGLLTYLVAQRTHELGVRIALGAQRSTILGMMLRQAGWLIALGAAVGVALSYFSTRMLSSFLFGVKPHDVANMLLVTVLLIACGMLAAFLPARKAATVDPMEALRSE